MKTINIHELQKLALCIAHRAARLRLTLTDQRGGAKPVLTEIEQSANKVLRILSGGSDE